MIQELPATLQKDYQDHHIQVQINRRLPDVAEELKSGNLHTHYDSNPTILSLETKLAALEGAESVWAFSSGPPTSSRRLFISHTE